MIGRIAGVLLEALPDRVLVDVGGVGYELTVPRSTAEALPAVGERAVLHVHTHVREDALQLFGFGSPAERVLFEKLLSVAGIGPRLAVTVLSGLPLQDLVRAIAAQDTRRLCQIPGVGKKLAERLGLELKEKVGSLLTEVSPSPASGSGAAEDAIGALLNLGYRRAQGEAAVKEAVAEVGGADFQRVLQAALRRLSR